MKLSLKWLSNFIDLSDLSTDEIIEKMVKCGFEVEAVDRLSEGTNLVVGKVIECKDHPNSDHLHITKTDIGSEVLDIVCGAPNCRTGLKVIVAKVGAKLPGGEIKAGVIRGEASNGMLCSLKELGIKEELLPADSKSHNGIEELDDVLEFFAAGAEAVQIGTANFTHPETAGKLVKELEDFITNNGFEDLNELKRELRA